MTERLRILWLARSISPTPTWGTAMRSWQLFAHLAARHDVTVLHYARADRIDSLAPVRARAVADHAIVPARPIESMKRRRQVATLLRRRSFWWWTFYSRAMQARLDAILAGGDFDVIHIDSSQMACFRLSKPAAISVIAEHNIEYELPLQSAQRGAWPGRRAYNRVEGRLLRREEEEAWRRVDGVAVPSAREAAIVRRAAHGTAAIELPNGADLDYFKPNGAAVEPLSIVFTGHFGFEPNRDAGRFFIREVFPRIRLEHPGAQLTVVGIESREAFGSVTGAGVHLAGVVDDIRAHLARAAVAVAPIRFGSGTRLKVLEALAMQKPVVSTRLGYEGLELRDSEHLLEADSAADFAARIGWVFTHPQQAAAMGTRGRRQVASLYAWPAIASTLESWYRELLDGRRQRKSA